MWGIRSIKRRCWGLMLEFKFNTDRTFNIHEEARMDKLHKKYRNCEYQLCED